MFASVLFVVFEVSGWIDSQTTQRLIGIVVPYMLPLLPLLFGVPKELSLLMIFQALGTQDINTVLGTVQILTLLVFITFYVPCISTFAIMHKTLGRTQAGFSVLLSVGVALLLSALVRLMMVLAA
ncbi:hypothetical protein [Rhodoferax sp.]|uniref:hypothetical protein n=1 Tax=Rhodoferax sp. TaxID=50421 RepID=UPI0025D3ED49|nr:hypothetical protein [Rhodoferax sp.]MCM2342525.1 hypothetical protein [Rhodoferax sp.]